MSEFVIKSIRTKSQVTVSYNDQGFLSGYSNDNNWDPTQWKYLFKNFPFTIHKLREWNENPLFKVDENFPDLSFNDFWDAYGNKVGSKADAKKKWELLSNLDRQDALRYIQVYNQYLLQNPGVAKAHPRTYLSQRRWDT